VDFDGIARFFLGGVESRAALLAPIVIPAGALAVKWAGLFFLDRRKIYFKA
jgi:hypothetical protein